MPRLVLATKNPGKVREIQAMLESVPVEAVSCAAFQGLPEITEDGETFEENAKKKAVPIATATGEVALADDSGLEVDALASAPGVRSARFAGETLACGPSRDRANYEKLLSLLKDVPDPGRTARFRCVVAVATPEGRVEVAEGVCKGKIASAPRGSGGFGYDPVFIPDGYGKTFGELGPEVKNAISHRARALQAAMPIIKAFLGAGISGWILTFGAVCGRMCT